jgi:hypothetical protein
VLWWGNWGKRRLEVHKQKDNIKLVHNWDWWAWTGLVGVGWIGGRGLNWWAWAGLVGVGWIGGRGLDSLTQERGKRRAVLCTVMNL